MKEEGFQPIQVTYIIALSECANMAALSLGKNIHSQINDGVIEWNIEMKTSLLNMYAKCGNIDEAHSIFDNM
jgi:pentatricopeptide repeat protein